MDIERPVLMQALVGGGATVLFIAMVVAVGTRGSGRGFDQQGAILLVGVIVAFVVVLGALGLALGDRMDAD